MSNSDANFDYSIQRDLPICILTNADTVIGVCLIYQGQEVVPDAVQVDVFLESTSIQSGPADTLSPVRYTVLEANASPCGLESHMVVQWTFTIGAETITICEQAFPCTKVLYPVVSDADLLALHDDLSELLDCNTFDFSQYRKAAWGKLQRSLFCAGIFPHRILGNWALKDLHIYKTLEIIFRDWSSRLTDTRYSDLAEYYASQFDTKLTSFIENCQVLLVDDDGKGFVEKETSLYLTAPKCGHWGRGW